MKLILLFMLLILPLNVYGKGNETIFSFTEAKNILLKYVYYDYHLTFYCKAQFNRKYVEPQQEFYTPTYKNREYKLEWEHVVPAQNFGVSFSEWTDGSDICFNQQTKKQFRGRKCAEIASKDFRRIESDLYNLYPAIGSVNAIRQNYTFEELPNIKPTFGSCNMKVYKNKVEPPDEIKGTIARTYLYMEDSYPDNFKMNEKLKEQMIRWDEKYPVDEWECERARRIEQIQGNSNIFVKNRCF